MAERGLPPAEGYPVLHCATHEKPFPCPDCVAARSEVPTARWSEQWQIYRTPGAGWILLADDMGLSSRAETLEVVPKLEAEQAIDNARKQGADQERQRLKEALLSDEVTDAACVRFECLLTDEDFQFGFPESFMREAIQAALDTLEADRG